MQLPSGNCSVSPAHDSHAHGEVTDQSAPVRDYANLPARQLSLSQSGFDKRSLRNALRSMRASMPKPDFEALTRRQIVDALVTVSVHSLARV